LQVHTTQERLRVTIEELGPTYIKFGQILADRPDMISERFRLELKKLQSKAIPMSDSFAHELIGKELGQPIEEVFAWIDDQCLASASIGQAYRARLKTGEEVVLKIQRPHIENKIKLDLYLMRYLARRAAITYPEMAAIDIVGLIDEFGANILKELNYYTESSNIQRFAAMFKDDPRVHIPKVFNDFTTRRLLVMEFIDGISPDHIHELKEKGYNMKTIAMNGADVILKMILEYGFFHADPHPGNIFIMPGNVIAFIDFGMAGVLRPRHMNFLADFAMGFARSDSKTISNALLHLCDVKFFDHEEDMQFEIEQLMRSNSYIPFEKLDFSKVIQDCLNIIVKYELRVPSSIFLLAKALATLQKFAMDLQPDMALGPVILPYAKKLVMQKYDPRKLASGIYETLTDYVTLVRDFPSNVNEILYKIKQGKIQHIIDLNDSEPARKAVRQFSQRIALVILLSGMLVVSTIMVTWGENRVLAHTSFTVAAIFNLWYVIKLTLKGKR
ncbi:MAG: ABC transporter, partial [Bacteroidetes bacterium HGW-Bacteroidetes-22]